ncbi:MAG TPA: LLM class flavin-dependent oxidoreductase [Burkholderiales bacterium]|nr:LLM class flavin-dependent oxidoreductase [Burkholderiales bacterium]
MALSHVGVAIHRPSAATILQTIAQAEAAGVPRVWLTTGAGPDALTVFAAAAASTRTVRMGTAIVPTFPRHPLVVAQQAADIAQLAPGRFVLGLGPSHAAIMEGRYGIPYRQPLGNLREFVAVVKRLLSGGQADFEGKHFKVHAKLNYGAQVPVIISALRESSFELAGEIADGAVTWLCPASYLRAAALPALERGAAQQGRARPKLIAHAFLALTSDPAALQQGVDEFLGHYPRLTNYQEMFAAAGYPEARQGAWSTGMVEAVVLHGTEDECREKLESFMRTSGCEEIILSIMLVGPDRDAVLGRALQWVGALS